MKEMLKGFMALGFWCQVMVIIDLIFMVSAIVIAGIMEKTEVMDYITSITMRVSGTGLICLFCQALWSIGREQLNPGEK